MNKQEKLQVYKDCKKEITILEETDGVDFCHFKHPFGCGFMVTREQDDNLGNLYDVNGCLERHIPSIIAMVYRFVMSR